MSTRTQLSKITVGTGLKATITSGGKPVISREDVLAALGMSRVKHDDTATHLILARYALEASSQTILEKHVLRIAWNLWLHQGRTGQTSVAAMTGLARLAVLDWCQTERVRQASETQISKFVGVDLKTWRKRYRAHYSEVIKRLYQLEVPKLVALTTALGSNVAAAIGAKKKIED